jgi:DNA-binding MarR family transcriptional regulator
MKSILSLWILLLIGHWTERVVAVKRVASVGSLLKKLHRQYNLALLSLLLDRGFTDLRPSFLEILLYICRSERPTIKEIGDSCALKKQTMTSHLNELERRGYIGRIRNPADRRQIHIVLTEYGAKFKLSLLESIDQLEQEYVDIVGELELERIESTLKNFLEKIKR